MLFGTKSINKFHCLGIKTGVLLRVAEMNETKQNPFLIFS